MSVVSEASRRRELEAALALPPSPRARARVRACAEALAPGGWTPDLLEHARAWMRTLPDGPVGAACFPAVCADGVVEVRVDVSMTAVDVVAGAAAPEAGVTDALRAAMAAELGAGGTLAVRFTPAEGWEGASCGLAVALAAVSCLRGRPLRRAVWATGAVAADGRVAAVGALAAKRAASEGRTLLEPLSEGAEWPVGTLAEAIGHAFGEGPPLPRVRTLRAAASAWVREARRAWEPVDAEGEGSPIPEDLSFERAWRDGARAVVVTGLPMSGRSWRLARFVEKQGEACVVVVLRPSADAPEALAAALDAQLGPLGEGDARSADPYVQVARLCDLAREVGREALVAVDDPGPATRVLLARLCAAGAARFVWTAPSTSEGAVPSGAEEIRCETHGLRSVALRGALPRAAWTPENRGVLEHPLAARVVPLLRERDWTAPLTLGELLRLLLANVLHGHAAHVGAPLWRRLGAHVLAHGDAPWSPPRALAPAARALAERGVLWRDGGGYRVQDRLLGSALRAEACADVVAGWPVLPPSDGWEQARDDGRRGRGGPAHLWSPWEDALVGACLTLGPSDARTVGRWCDALARRWAATPTPRRRAARSDALRVQFALIAGIARADLLGARAMLPRLARAIARHAPARVPLVAAGLTLAVAYDTWPLALRRRARTQRLIARVERALGSGTSLAPLRMLVSGDRAAVAEAVARGDVPVEPDAAWLPVLHVALLEDAWDAGRHADVATDVHAFQEAVARAWHAFMGVRAEDVAIAPKARREASEEAAHVAAARLRVAEAAGDADALAWWTPRTHAPVERHGLGADGERALAREVYVSLIVGA